MAKATPIYKTQDKEEPVCLIYTPAINKLNNYVDNLNHAIDASDILNDIIIKNVNKLVIGNLYINAFTLNFDQFMLIIQNKLDVITRCYSDNAS